MSAHRIDTIISDWELLFVVLSVAAAAASLSLSNFLHLCFH
jgi:hypothetical protein